MNYYNEFDKFTAAWLRELIKAKLIPAGEVDERSIVDVQPGDLAGFRQCHFFAGIGGWPYALKLAGWPEDREVWTGSCPCQPFSVGATENAKGTGDHRDLWPRFFMLIQKRKPATLFGEQVRNAISWGWWDRAKMDLEGADYSAAAVVMRTDAIRFPHQRKRLYFVADSSSQGREGFKQNKCLSCGPEKALTEFGNAASRAWSVLDSNFNDLRLHDGLSVAMERRTIKGYGNAIVPQVAAEFIAAFMECKL